MQQRDGAHFLASESGMYVCGCSSVSPGAGGEPPGPGPSPFSGNSPSTSAVPSRGGLSGPASSCPGSSWEGGWPCWALASGTGTLAQQCCPPALPAEGTSTWLLMDDVAGHQTRRRCGLGFQPSGAGLGSGQWAAAAGGVGVAGRGTGRKEAKSKARAGLGAGGRRPRAGPAASRRPQSSSGVTWWGHIITMNSGPQFCN